MHKALKMIFLAVCLLIAAFFANYFGFISIPWLELDSGPIHGSKVKVTDKAVQQLIESEQEEKAKK